PFPSILVQRGVLVAFSSPDHLAALQRGRSWRNRFDELLSPTHLFLPAESARPALQALARRGFTVAEHLPAPPAAPPSGSAAERLRLLYSACVHQELAREFELPPPYTPAELEALIAGLSSG